MLVQISSILGWDSHSGCRPENHLLLRAGTHAKSELVAATSWMHKNPHANLLDINGIILIMACGLSV